MGFTSRRRIEIVSISFIKRHFYVSQLTRPPPLFSHSLFTIRHSPCLGGRKIIKKILLPNISHKLLHNVTTLLGMGEKKGFFLIFLFCALRLSCGSTENKENFCWLCEIAIAAAGLWANEWDLKFTIPTTFLISGGAGAKMDFFIFHFEKLCRLCVYSPERWLHSFHFLSLGKHKIRIWKYNHFFSACFESRNLYFPVETTQISRIFSFSLLLY